MSASGFSHEEGSIPCEPIAADVAGTVNEFVVGAGLYDIAVRAVGIAARQVGLVVRCGEDDDRDRSETGIGPESNQKVTAIPSAELEIEEDKGGRASWHGLFARETRGLRRSSLGKRRVLAR